MSKWEYMFPIVYAYRTNKQIKAISEDETRLSWKNKLTEKNILSKQIRSIVSNTYVNENKRRTDIENKASWLSVGTSISVLLMIAVLNYSLDLNTLNIFCLFVFPVVNFIISGIGVHVATRISQIHVFDIEKILERMTNIQELDMDIIIEQLTIIELNRPIVIQKANYVIAAQIHFLYGIFFIPIGFLLLILW